MNTSVVISYYFQYTEICTFSLKNNLCKKISIAFLIITVYYVHLAYLENTGKKSPKILHQLPFHKQSVPHNLLFYKYFCNTMYSKVMATKVSLYLAKQKLFYSGFFKTTCSKIWRKNLRKSQANICYSNIEDFGKVAVCQSRGEL